MYLKMQDYDSATEKVKEEFDDQISKHGRITNMKKTLLNHVPSFKAYMEWYTLYDELAKFLPERAITLFSYAISKGNDCLVCGSFFREILIKSGDDPDNPNIDETESLLMELGEMISQNPHNIPDYIYDDLKARYTDAEITQIFAFAGIMAATNLFNTIARVDLDSELYEYRLDTKETK